MFFFHAIRLPFEFNAKKSFLIDENLSAFRSKFRTKCCATFDCECGDIHILVKLPRNYFRFADAKFRSIKNDVRSKNVHQTNTQRCK